MNIETREARQMFHSRACYVCGKHIPEGDGLYCAHLGILVHYLHCGTIVDSKSRDYSVSKRGRWVPRTALLKRLRELRPSA